MLRTKTAACAASAVIAFCTSVAAEDMRVRVRGTIEAFAAPTLTLKTVAGPVTVDVPAAAAIATTKAFAMADITPGMLLGVTSIQRADGATVAVEVHPIPAEAALGLTPSDLAPGATMNNGAAEATAGAIGAQELTLDYKTGAVKVKIVPETRFSQRAPGSVADLAIGETVYVLGAKNDAGKITARFVQVSKDGLKPAM